MSVFLLVLSLEEAKRALKAASSVDEACLTKRSAGTCFVSSSVLRSSNY